MLEELIGYVSEAYPNCPDSNEGAYCESCDDECGAGYANGFDTVRPWMTCAETGSTGWNDESVWSCSSSCVDVDGSGSPDYSNAVSGNRASGAGGDSCTDGNSYDQGGGGGDDDYDDGGDDDDVEEDNDGGGGGDQDDAGGKDSDERGGNSRDSGERDDNGPEDGNDNNVQNAVGNTGEFNPQGASTTTAAATSSAMSVPVVLGGAIAAIALLYVGARCYRKRQLSQHVP